MKNFCCKYFFFLLKLHFHANKVKFNAFFKKFIYFRPPDFIMGKLPIVWFFATTEHQRISFMVLVKTKLVQNSVKVSEFSLHYSWRKSKKSVI